MKTCALMYHNVGGIQGKLKDRYDLPREHFIRHLDFFEENGYALRTALEHKESASLILTVDDGYASGMWIAEQLSKKKWKAFFFVVTDWIGKEHYFTSQDIVELSNQGHVIGSHAHTHVCLAMLSQFGIDQEWNKSVSVLEDLLGRNVECASVPGGNYDQRVLSSVTQAGIRNLFTSNPTFKVEKKSPELSLIGRMALEQGTSLTQLKQWLECRISTKDLLNISLKHSMKKFRNSTYRYFG